MDAIPVVAVATMEFSAAEAAAAGSGAAGRAPDLLCFQAGVCDRLARDREGEQ